MTGQVVHVLLVEDDEVDSEAIVRSFQKHNLFFGRVTFPNNINVRPFNEINISLQICINCSLATQTCAFAYGTNVFSINTSIFHCKLVQTARHVKCHSPCTKT